MKKIIAAVIAVIIFITLGAWIYLGGVLNQVLTFEGDSLFFVVEDGDTFTAISNRLEAQGIIDNAQMYRLAVRVREERATIFAGAYEFGIPTTLGDFYHAVVTGNAISDEVQVTFPEGFVIDDMAEELVGVGLIENTTEFTTAATLNTDRFTTQFDFLESIPDGQGLEGYLFPDTYRFFADATVDEVIMVMLRNFDTKLDNAARQEIARSGKSIHEVITLASLVEKEVRGVDEMKVVAGLFQNRLDIGMLLQADSTIQYVTKSGRDRSTFADLEINSPYNTYKFAGLPPGPISNPGLNAITAAINPAETDYLFFLTNRTSGQVYYGKTLAEHNRNRDLYLE